MQLQAELVKGTLSLELRRNDLATVANGEGTVSEQKSERCLHPETEKPIVLGYGGPCAEDDELHFLVLRYSLLHARPTRRLHRLCLHAKDHTHFSFNKNDHSTRLHSS